MPDLDLTRPVTELFSSEADLKAWMRIERQTIDADLAAQRAEVVPTPTPPTPAVPVSDALTARRAEAKAAAAADTERTQLVSDARALLNRDLPARGYSPALLDGMPEDELLALAGLAEPTSAEKRLQEDEAIGNDPARYAAHLVAAEATRLQTHWWQLSPQERSDECERLGLDYHEADKAKQIEMQSRGY